MRASRISCIIALLAGTAASAGAQETADKAFTARTRPADSPITADGRLDEVAWQTATWRSDFQQKVPTEGGTPSARTEVAFLYDDDALYVGARMRSTHPEGIPTTVARRDQFTNAEHLIVALDTYRDRRTAYVFSISSGGVRGDYYNPSDSEGDREMAWDPVWRAGTTVDSTGWYAEMRIPFSQLRFASGGTQLWGVQVNRWMPHADEDVYWIVIPARETGWASRFGELRGVTVAHAPRRLEVTPYVAANATFASADPGDPFNDGSLTSARGGADLKMGLGPNLTLDATINPDFGQVEADPAEVNLTAFETFFSERRPFFTEGNQLLVGGGANFYYSRRIGQAPRGFAGGDYVDRPSNSTILGAAKLSGRLRSGLSVGALTAFTGAEEARTFSAGSGFGQVPIEPFTAYGIGRVQQEFGPNASTAGLSLTAVHRDLEPGSPLAALLPRTAVTGGGDVNLRTAGGAYQFGASFGFSHLAGDPEAILGVQLHPAHFMQRPDATEFTLDPTRRSLDGWGLGLEARKASGRHWVWEVDLSAESPGFDLNDAGQLGSANDINVDASLVWRETQPGPLFRRHSHDWYVGRGWNFGGVHTGTASSLGNSFQLRNFWNLFVGGYVEARAMSDDLTRGGPLMGTALGHGFDLSLNGREGAPITWRSSASYFGDEHGGWSISLRGGIATRPAPRWSVSIDPRWSRSVTSRQYVTAVADGPAATFGTRYVFAFVDRNTLSAQLRLNYAFTPDLTLELYAEPFAASGTFRDFGELLAARSRDLRTYGTDGTSITRTDGGYTVTADGDTFGLPDRDFSVLSFRSNLVLRWEWLRGSTLYLVWQQDRSGLAERPVGIGSLFDTFDADGRNFVALKMTYWMAAR
ncbi:MAG TPA: DUF5916 domain-containing protein [Gemmatimonadales bacterium]